MLSREKNRSMRKQLLESVRGLLVIGMMLQCILGLIWTVLNFTHFQNLQRTQDYIQAGKTLVTDEYMGILYPLLIAGTDALGKISGIPFYCFLYVLQMAAGFAAGCLFFYLFRRGRGKIFSLRNMGGSLFLLTVPMALQCHLAVLPQSLVCSAFLIMAGLCYDGVAGTRNLDSRFFLAICGLWLAMGLLQPDYLYLAGIPAVFLLAVGLIRRCRLWKRALPFVLLTIFLIVDIGRVTASPGSYGRIQRSMGAAMVSRMVWPNFSTTYFFWPEEVKEVMSVSQGEEISAQSDRVQTMFGPMLEKAYGKETADRYYWQMALQCLQVRTKEIVEATWKDFTAYLCVPLSLKSQLDGSGISFSGWNYGQMREHASVLTRYYVHYSLWMFRIGILISVCVAVVSGIKSKQKKGIAGLGILAALCLFPQAVWYTMSGAGMMDYLNVTPVTIFWYACLAAACRWLRNFLDKEEK